MNFAEESSYSDENINVSITFNKNYFYDKLILWCNSSIINKSIFKIVLWCLVLLKENGKINISLSDNT